MSKVIHLNSYTSGFGITVSRGSFIDGVYTKLPNLTIQQQKDKILKEHPNYKFSSLVEIPTKCVNTKSALLILDK